MRRRIAVVHTGHRQNIWDVQDAWDAGTDDHEAASRIRLFPVVAALRWRQVPIVAITADVVAIDWWWLAACLRNFRRQNAIVAIATDGLAVYGLRFATRLCDLWW